MQRSSSKNNGRTRSDKKSQRASQKKVAVKNAKNGQGKVSGTVGAMVHRLTGRDGIVLLLFVLLALWMFTRLFTLTVVEAETLSGEGSEVRTTDLTITARRGTIYDRNGEVLATSVEAVTIYANPSKIVDPKETSEILHEILGGDAKDYYASITDDPESTFVYLAQKVDEEFQQELEAVNQEYLDAAVAAYREQGDDIPAEIITPLTGIEFLPDMRREYPKGSIGAQVIGSVDAENIGISGLEQTYDSILRGVDGTRVVEEAKVTSQSADPLPMIDSVIKDVEPVAGSDIIISLDIEMQQFLEMNLAAVAAQRSSNNASAALLDGSTGEIIATASIPLYDRENITSEQAEQGATNVKAITQPYEPGSTFKAIIAAAALEQGLMTADDTIFCPSTLDIYDKTIKDSVDRPDEDMSLRKIISHSSNIGVSLIEQQLGDEVFYDYLTKLKLGEYTHVDYPGETPGTLAPVEEWTPIQSANISFGQGLEVTLLQMTSIYGAIANDGVMVQPHFLISRPQLDQEITYDSTRVFEAQTARDLEELLRSCVTDGYGVNAAVSGYDAAGKTGTAEMSDLEGGYESSQGRYFCSFAGYLDNSTSNLVFMSSFENPTNYADSPATKFFSVVMSFVANRYMIQPQEEAPVGSGIAADASDLENIGDSMSGEGQGSLSEGTADAASTESPSTSSIVAPTPRAGRDWILDTTG